MMKKLAGKFAVVTGAASGIGRASVLRFAAEGAQVYALNLNAEGLAETHRLATESGNACTTIEANAADESAMAAAVERCVEE